MNQLIRTKTIHFSTLKETPNEYMIQALRESGEDWKLKKYKSFESKDDALAYIDTLIHEDTKN